jgi:hypothetical protein
MTKIPATDFGEPLPPEVEDRVLAEVEPGEAIAWVGRPQDRRRFFLSLLPLWLVGIPWTTFSIFWTVMASGIAGQIPGPGGFGVVAALFGLPFIAGGCAMLAAPFWAMRKAGQVAYVVTDRRAIFFEPAFPTGQKIVSLRPGDFGPLERVERGDGTGDLTFGVPLAAQPRANATAVARKFVGIPQVREVEALVRRTLLDRDEARA